MSLTRPSSDNYVIAVDRSERWEIYRRLQELHISCQCSPHQPLQVQILDSTAAIQLWSIVKQSTSSRYELISWLHRCWQLHSEENS
ncbi:MAG: Asr1405/Asl0597 family protein [Cyanophyceae cyanobacterium]